MICICSWVISYLTNYLVLSVHVDVKYLHLKIKITLWCISLVLGFKFVYYMVLILYGKQQIGAQVRSNLCYLTCLRYLIRSRNVTNPNLFFRKRPIFLHVCTTYSKVPCNISSPIFTSFIKSYCNILYKLKYAIFIFFLPIWNKMSLKICYKIN